MGGNMRHASHQRKKKKRRERRERLRQERKDGQWSHMTIEVGGEAHERWVKTPESDKAVRLYIQEHLTKPYVRELSAKQRLKEVNRLLDEDKPGWIISVLHPNEMPELEE